MKSIAIANNTDYFSSLPAKVRTNIQQWIEVIELVVSAPNLERGVAMAAQKHGHLRGFSEVNIKRKVRAYKKHGWQALIDKAMLGKGNASLTIGEHFKRYCEQNQRSSREAWGSMMRDFRAGKYFEDVGTWREVWGAEHPDKATPYNCPLDYIPKGWTYRNLMRTCGLTEYEITASRIGRGAARDFLPSVFSTRVGLLVGQIYMFDDMWHDAKVNFLGTNTRAQRPIEIACVDVASACRCAWGLKPRREDLDTGKMRNLTECDMRMLLAHVLINLGYNPTGCELVVEHGTAAVAAELERLLSSLSGGIIKVGRSGIISDPIHKGLYCGQPRGNYKRKAALESQHSLAHTVAAALQGQIGKDRDHSPEQMYGLEHYNNQLAKCAAALPPERARLLMYPLLPFDQYVSAIADLYRTMNFRTWHDLEGWEECGHVATEFRLHPTSNDWMPMESLFELPPPEQARLLPALQLPDLCRTRKLSPQEVYDRGAAGLVRLPKSTMPLILGERLGIVKEVRDDGLITYQNREYGPGEFRYLARDVQTPDGFRINLQAGRKYLVHINPFALDECFVTDAESGAYIGLARRWQTVCKDDTAALERMAGKQAHIEAELRGPMARRGQQIIKQKTDMLQNNAAVLRGDAVTDAEKTDLARIRKARGSMTDVFGSPDEEDFTEQSREQSRGGRLSDIWNNDNNNMEE